MAVVIENDKAFLHIPKTGGMWVRKLLQVNNLDHSLYQPETVTGFEAVLMSWKEKHHAAAVPDGIKKENTFCILRNPADWYESFYLYRRYSEKWKWNKKREFDTYVSEQGRSDFSIFIREIAARYPYGFLAGVFTSYVKLCGEVFTMKNMESKIVDFLGSKDLIIPEPENTRRKQFLMNESDRAFIDEWECNAAEMVKLHE